MRAPTSDAIGFLEKLRPGGPWVLTAIEPDGPAIDTITAHSPEHVAAFVEEFNGRRNLYYSVNPTRTALGKKASKTDVAWVEFALADLDPNAVETSDAGKRRYLDQLNGGSFQPRPDAAVDSGNGIQGLWRLEERIELGAPVIGKEGKLVFSPEDQGKIDDVETRVKAIMLRLGAKPGPQNIDRILRLPGTTNLPNAKKRKEGRVACQTRLLWFCIGDENAIYLVGQLPLTLVDAAGLDRLVGSVYLYVEQFFRPALHIGWASRFS